MKFIFQYGAAENALTADALSLCLQLKNPSLGPCFEEIWDFPDAKLETADNFKLLRSPDGLCGAICLDTEPEQFEASAQQLYTQLFELTRGLHIHRIWQFIPGINDLTNGLENYQAYNLGRSAAFDAEYANQAPQLIPAASAVGTCGSRLVLAFIAGQAPGTHLENPKQTPAYRYPERYGPRPPSFARATSVETSPPETLYVSGTASIRGSDNVGESIEEQLATTFENIGIMREQFQLRYGHPAPTAHRRYRVYIRKPKDYPEIRERIEQVYKQEGDQFIYLIADICRAELDLEIELTLSDRAHIAQ